ncbi:hypothetical protein [Paramixta manurensis]|uniref:hypothetical protein n=1 Tax=Paramixta manurensis TaxID=2740817 RepID=UPI00339558C6
MKENIFHPQGGGQPADTGWINDIPVKIRRHISGLVAVYPQEAIQYDNDTRLTALLSAPERLRNAALHTAGHLLNCELHQYGWVARSGHHFPGEARVEFTMQGAGAVLSEDLPVDKISENIIKKLRHGAKVSAWMEGETRLTLIENTVPIACGGTHVENINQIGGFLIKAVKFKKDVLRISYDAEYAIP